MTPHNQAKLGEIAKNVLMPGDPLRAKFIAETFLTNVKQVNSVRNMLAFTGEYKGKEITVMASGMGMPSIGIYSYELYSVYGVENIIRVGSAGAYSGDLKVYDVVLAAKRLEIPLHVSRIHSSDVFYREGEPNYYKTLCEEKGVSCVEMESFALFHNARVLGKKAACLLTISDSFVTKEVTTAEERQTAFVNMMKVALETFC